MAHTPGPWQFYELKSANREGLGYIRTEPEDGSEIAHHGDTSRSWSENVANAHLIAAAPELLAALKAIAAMVDRDLTARSEWAIPAELIAAHEAIAKAETV